MRWTRRLGLAVLVGAVGYGSVGCAQERDPINRVQVGALSKHFFAGADLSSPKDDPEFYMRNTIVDVPAGADQEGLFTATYSQPLSRIKWEITENALVARQTYERVQDSDHNGARTTNNGQVVAMFAISSHFDIRRAYNPTTGEEQNIIEENSQDRPWYQREYFRVDWSKNLVTDGYEVDTLSSIGLIGGVKFDPMSYYVEDPADPNAPAFDQEDGYFDVTTKAFATPQLIDTPYGSYPSCYFYGHQGSNCNPTELTLRLSFKKVVDHDFEPEEWDGNKMNAFGWFTEDRLGYERNYGIIDDKWHRLAAKYNPYVKSHIEGSQCNVDYYRDVDGNVAKYKTDGQNFLTDPATGLPIPDKAGQPFPATPVGADPNRDTNSNKTADECEFHDKDGNLLHAGSRCDTLTRKCTLPLYERSVQTIPWYYGPEAPADLFPSTAKALDEWNVAVKRAVQIGRKVSAARVGAQVVNTDGSLTDPNDVMIDEQQLIDDNGAKVTHIFVLCHNPTVASDDKACFGGPNHDKPVYARVGDIRYNMVNIINNPQNPSPWGIMVDADDPLTGEKVSTSVNEWGHVLDLASQGSLDLLRWINGELTDDQITSGQYIRDWAKATDTGVKQYTPQVLSKTEIQQRIASINVANMTGDTSPAKASLYQMTPKQIDEMVNTHAKASQQTFGPSLDATFEGRRASLIGTKFEAMLATPEMVQAAGFDPNTPVAAGDSSVLAAASPIRGMNPQMMRWLQRIKNKALGARGFCQVEQPEPDALVGLARHAARLYPLPDPKDPNYPALKHQRDENLRQWIREQFHISVIAHEMGHSMGLRHNFTGSWDALNYHLQYWQLRTRNGQEKACIKRAGNGAADGASITTPHTDGHDCVGPRWIDPVTDEETNGLIWKWGSSTVMDYPGDQTQDMNDIGNYDKAAMRFGYGHVADIDVDQDGADGTKSTNYGNRLDGFGGISGFLETFHYSELNDMMTSSKNPQGILGKCTSQTDPNDPLSATCTGMPLDFVSLDDMKANGTDAQSASVAVDPKGRVRHPYMFGSDEYADFGNMPVFRFDSGADAYEQQQFLTTTYENRYIFDNFRRDKVLFNSGAVIDRVSSRYFDKMTAATKAVGLYLGELPQYKDQLLAEPGYLMPHAIASADSFATFIRVLTRPEPGDYFLQGAGYAQVPDSAPSGSQQPSFHISVGSGEGRYLHNDYDYSKGYYWGDYQTQAGSFYEKMYAVYYLTEAYNNFIQNSKRSYIDGRYLNLNYSSLYPDQMRRIFSQLMQNDPMTLGPYVNLQGGSLGGIPTAHVTYLPWEKYVAGDATTTAPKYPAGAVVLNPLVGWEEQFPALINGFLFGQTTLTMDWDQQMRIFSPGGSDTVDVPIDQQYRYVDPLSSITYASRNYGEESVNGKTVMRTAGARMLQYANQLAASTFKVTGTDPVTGALTYARDPVTNEPVCAIDAATCASNRTILKGYSANLDTVRELARFYGYGPL